MTVTNDATEAPAPEVPEIAQSAEVVAAIHKGIGEVEGNKITLAQLAAAITSPTTETKPVPKPVARPTQINDRHRLALTRLPEVFGKVNPTEVRVLTQDEIDSLAEERGVIDTLSSLLTSRKDDDIREIIANHFDALAEERGLAFPEDVHDDEGNLVHAATPRDKNGHYVLKQREDAPKVGRYFERRIVSGSKPSLNGARLLQAYEDGKIDRATYLACTRETRVFDEAKAREAIKKNPGLLFLLAEHAVTPAGQDSTAIYAPDLKG